VNIIATNEEQNICKSCGFCCDGTLFSHVKLQPNENIINYSSLKLLTNEHGSQFNQPCAAFNENGCCQIYPDRPNNCKIFSCKILRRFKRRDLTKEEALGLIARAKELKDDLINEAEKGNIIDP